MPELDISNARASDMENAFTETTVAPKTTEGISDAKETWYVNSLWPQHWAYFNEHPELKAAILMKAIWNVGKGYIADPQVEAILDGITGWGKDTFQDVLFNLEVCRRIGRDSFAEIIRDDETGELLNLKPLDPSSIRIVVNEKGILERYEQISKLGKTTTVLRTFKPQEIFQLSNNRLADQIHGISDIESLDKTILAEIESFTDIKKVMHRQAKPFIIFKLKTDNEATINALVAKVDALRNKGEDLFIPDDEDILSYEVVQVNMSSVIMQWRQEVTNKFYRALGLPMIIFGTSGSTESGGKMEYFAHEQVFEHDQRFLENQIWAQLGLRINLIPPTSMAQALQSDSKKDAMQGLEIQPSDVTAGKGR